MKSFDEALKEILDYADKIGAIDDGALDEEVHDVASAIASTVNNGGLEEQVKYLLTHDGPHDATIENIKKTLKENV